MANVKSIANKIFKYIVKTYRVIIILVILIEIIMMFMNYPITHSYWEYHLLAIVAFIYIFNDLKGTLTNIRKRDLQYKIKEKYGVDVEFAVNETIEEYNNRRKGEDK